jgi:uncharacterized protein
VGVIVPKNVFKNAPKNVSLLVLACLLLPCGSIVEAKRSKTTVVQPVLSSSVYIPGLTFERQTYNNCGPASVSGILGAYGFKVSQEEVKQVLRPTGTGYMRADVIDGYVRQFGLRATVFANGDTERIKRVLRLGVPILVLQWLRGSGDGKNFTGEIPHFRTVRGFDDRTGQFWMSDPMLSDNAVISYKDFTLLWGVYNYWFIPVYADGMQPKLEAALGVRIPRG